MCFLWLPLFILSGAISPVISSSELGTYRLGNSSFSVLSFSFSYCSCGSQGKNIEVVCHSFLQWQWPQGQKRSVFFPIPKKGNAKECSNYHMIALLSHTSKAMVKILQVRLQQYVNCELPDVQAGFRKGRGTRVQIANICWVIEKTREVHKYI